MRKYVETIPRFQKNNKPSTPNPLQESSVDGKKTVDYGYYSLRMTCSTA